MKLGVVILAGGASSRMGQDKALLGWAGRGAIDRLTDLAARVRAAEVVLAGRGDRRLTTVVDEPLGSGPVGGIAAGIGELIRPGVDRALVLAVGAPALTPDDLAPLLAAPAPGAAYEGLNLPLVLSFTGAPPETRPGWPVGRFIAAAGLVRLAPPPGAALRLRGANTADEQAALLVELARRERAEDPDTG